MKSLAFETLSRIALSFPLLVGAGAAISACGAPSPDEGVDAEEAAQGMSTGPGEPRCTAKNHLLPKACNTIKCDVDEYFYVPTHNASPCTTSSGKSGKCATDWQAGSCFETLTGSMTPKYYVLSVEYAPPGAASTVDYGTGATWGSTTSTSKSFTTATSVTASNNESVLGFGAGGISVTGSVSTEDTTSSSFDLKETMTTDLTLNGNSDGVDHGLDRIYLWLTPEVDITTFGNDVSWSLRPQPGQPPHVVYVTPTWLLNGTVPSNVLLALQQAGITPDDYAQILSVDPYANGAAALDSARYVLQTELPYEPVTVAGERPTASKFALTRTSTTTVGSESKVAYSVGVTLKGGVDFLGLVKLKLERSDKMTWTSDNKSSNSNGSTTSATATITQPAFGYTGGVYLDVYVDSIYNTFLFVIEPQAKRQLFPGVGPGLGPVRQL